MSDTSPNDYEAVKLFNLLGHEDEVVYDKDDPETLPADIRSINFAEKKLGESTAAWAEKSKERSEGHKRHNALSRDEVVRFAVIRLLGEHCASRPGIDQAATIFLDLQDLELATTVVDTMIPLKWPAKALAQRVLGILNCILMPYSELEGNQARTYREEADVSYQIDKVLSTCDSVIGSKIGNVLKAHFLTASNPDPPRYEDIKAASELLSFCSAGDFATIGSIITVLDLPHSRSSPPDTIVKAVSALVENEASEFLRLAREDMRRHWNMRSTPSLFPRVPKPTISSRPPIVRSPSVDSSRARTMTFGPPMTVKVEDADGDFNPGSVSTVTRRKKPSSVPSSPRRFTSPLPEPRGGHSIIVQNNGGSLSHIPGIYSSSSSILKAHKYTEETLGSGPDKFKWWNIVLDAFTSVEDITLHGQPAPGDVLTYWNKALGEAGAYLFSGEKWNKVTKDYYANTGEIYHPSFDCDNDPRVLTWKSQSKLQPTWVQGKYFKSKKSKLGSHVIVSLDEYNRMIFSDKRPGGSTITFVSDERGGE